MKIHQHFPDHMTKMASMPIYLKISLKIFFPGTLNHWADFYDKTLYDASETLALYYLCKLLPWVDLDLFYGMVLQHRLSFYLLLLQLVLCCVAALKSSPIHRP